MPRLSHGDLLNIKRLSSKENACINLYHRRRRRRLLLTSYSNNRKPPGSGCNLFFFKHSYSLIYYLVTSSVTVQKRKQNRYQYGNDFKSKFQVAMPCLYSMHVELALMKHGLVFPRTWAYIRNAPNTPHNNHSYSRIEAAILFQGWRKETNFGYTQLCIFESAVQITV